MVDQGRSMMTVFRNVRKQVMRLVDGDKALVHRENDADIKFRYAVRARMGEMLFRTMEHFFGTSYMEAKVALAPIAEFFLEVFPAVPAIGMRPEVEHRRIGMV